MLETTRNKYLNKLATSLRDIIERYRENLQSCGIRFLEIEEIFLFPGANFFFKESIPQLRCTDCIRNECQ